ncbi:MAG TPA: UvrD-helicase domain-containing protein [Thermoanaerobaculia bacterium]|nr:UvrD-helicase domain-containing protein [Thermoanaerobaculia bacterium]
MRTRTEAAAFLADQQARDAIREDLDSTILVEAAAGTGKTRSLVERMVALVATGKTSVDRLSAVTFTIRAAAQLKQRFQGALEEALREEAHPGRRERLAAALRSIDLCFVGTIHAFAARLLRERPVEAGIEPGFAEMDEPENGAARQEAWNRFTERLFVRGDPRLARLIDLHVRLNDLTEAFADVCENSDIEMAPAERLPEPDFSRARAAVAQFLKLAAGSLPSQAPAGGWTGFQAAVRRALRLFELLDPSRAADFVEILRVLKPSTVGDSAGAWKAPIKRLRNEVIKPSLARWAEYVYPDVLPLLLEAREEFRRWRRRNGRANFQDLLVEGRNLLRDHETVRTELFARFTPILVDEFQDTDPIQAEILFYLTGTDRQETDWRSLQPAPGSLFVVGDPKQSIYRFRRADILIYQRVRESIERCGRVLRLSTNFRSTPSLCDWVNGTFGGKGFFGGDSTPLQAEYVPLVASRADSSNKPPALRIETPAAGNSDLPVVEADSARIADFIAASVGKRERRPEDFLVLFRKRRFMGEYARALEARGIAADLGGGRAFGDSEELSTLMPILQTLADPDDPVALVAALRGPVFGVDDDALYRFSRVGGRFHLRTGIPSGTDAGLAEAFELLREGEELARTLPPAAAIARLVQRLGLAALAAAQPLGQSRAGNLAKALSAARKFSAEGADFGGVVRELESLRHQDLIEQMSLQPGRAGAVRLLTIHGAKGLEAPVVLLAAPVGNPTRTRNVFVDRDASPPVGAFRVIHKTGEFSEQEIALPPGWEEMRDMEERFEKAEEARLLYVAATRAEELLAVSVKRNKNASASGPWCRLDPFLRGELPQPAAPRESGLPWAGHSPIEELAAFRARSAERRVRAGLPGYSVASVTAVAHDRAARPGWDWTGKGMSWGRVLHGLLEASMRDPELDLRACAANLLAEEGRSAEEVDEAVRLVRSVHASPLWRRALESPGCLVEVPFALAAPGGSAGAISQAQVNLLTGAIDLVFEEKDGWIVVDYKSDLVSGNRAELIDFYRPQVLRYRDEWQRLTGKMTKAGLYFIHTGEEVWLD